MFGLVSVPRYQPPLRIALWKAFTHCDLQKEMPNPGTAFPGLYRAEEGWGLFHEGNNQAPHCLLLAKDSSSVHSRPRAGEQLVDSSEGAAIHYSRSCWTFCLEAAQKLGVTNIGWNVIPFPLFFLSEPLGPLPSVYCLREMQHNLASHLEPIYCVHTGDDSEKICLHAFNFDLPCWQNKTNLYKYFFIF